MWASILAVLTKIPALITGVDIPAILASIQHYWKYILLALFILLQFTTAWGAYHYHDLLFKEKIVHQQDVTNFKTAQATANSLADKQRVILQKESKANADQADAKYSGLLAQYRSSLLRYKASQSGTGKADHYQLPPTESGDGSGPSPVISITLDDAQICAVNTARLQAVHDWHLTHLRKITNENI